VFLSKPLKKTCFSRTAGQVLLRIPLLQQLKKAGKSCLSTMKGGRVGISTQIPSFMELSSESSGRSPALHHATTATTPVSPRDA
jgi:hypothetical protein